MHNPLKYVIEDRDLPIENRISMMFVSVGILLSVLGFFLCIACHASVYGIGAVAAISVVSSIVTLHNFKTGGINVIRKAMIWLVTIQIPIVFLTAGGIHSGCPAWVCYALIYIALACKKNEAKYFIIPSAILNSIVCYLDVIGSPYVLRLATNRDMEMSIVGSWGIVTFSILLTIILYKKIYNDEKEALKEANIKLSAANDYEKTFLANMSHELRTPINSILGFNELILQDAISEQVKESAEYIKNSSAYLLSLINDILDYSKIDAGEMVLEEDAYNTRELIQQCYKLVEKQAKDKDLQFIVKVHPDIPEKLFGDKNRIQQIIINLLTNAIKYTPKGSVTLVVNKEFIPTSPNDVKNINLDIYVIDTGIGISEKQKSIIFGDYKRTDKVKHIEGTGLGLGISKKLAELMQGGIEVQSTVGVGSTFKVSIPQIVLSEKTIESFSVKDTPKVAETDKKPKQTPFATTDVLVVDDTPLNLKLMEKFVVNAGYSVVTVGSGKEAIDYLSKNNAKIVFMDIMMPEMDGIEAMKIIKASHDIPVIALTADATSGAKDEYENSGFDGYLSKPILLDVLKETLHKYL